MAGHHTVYTTICEENPKSELSVVSSKCSASIAQVDLWDGMA